MHSTPNHPHNTSEDKDISGPVKQSQQSCDMGNLLRNLFRFFLFGELLPYSAKEFWPATNLAWGGVAVDDRLKPSMICIHLKKFKCDQFGTGADVILGKTGGTICPVAAIVAFLALCGHKLGSSFLILHVDQA